MKLEIFTEEKKIAIEKWREYTAAEKVSKNPMYKELKTLYNQIKSGRKVIDIFKTIKKGGVHHSGEHNRLPKLAIARADQKKSM